MIFQIFPVSLLLPEVFEGRVERFNMAAVEGSLEEALKRRERLKAMRKKSGLPDEQVSEFNYVCF